MKKIRITMAAMLVVSTLCVVSCGKHESKGTTVAVKSQPDGTYGKKTNYGANNPDMQIWWILDFRSSGQVQEFMFNTFTSEKEIRNVGRWAMSNKSEIKVVWNRGHSGWMKFDGKENDVFSNGVTFGKVRINTR